MPTLVQDKKTKLWKVRDRRGGRDVVESLGTRDRGLAEERYGKWLAANGGDRWKEVQHTYDEAVRKMGAEHLPLLRPNSVRAYARHALTLTPHFQGRLLSDISRADLSAYEHARRQDGVKPSTIIAELHVLSAVFGCAIEAEWVEHNPVRPYLQARKKKGLARSDPKTRYLSLEEEKRLLEVARGLDEALYPGRDMILAALILAIDTGLRSSELLGLPWADVDLINKEITVKADRAKSGHERRVPILPRSEKVLRGLRRHYASPYVLHRRNGSRYDNLKQQMRRLIELAQIEHASWHDLRRTCGCRLLQVHKLPMHAVSAWLGHSSTTITETTYAFLRVDDLHAAVGTVRGLETVKQTLETEETFNKFRALPNG